MKQRAGDALRASTDIARDKFKEAADAAKDMASGAADHLQDQAHEQRRSGADLSAYCRCSVAAGAKVFRQRLVISPQDRGPLDVIMMSATMN